MLALATLPSSLKPSQPIILFSSFFLRIVLIDTRYLHTAHVTIGFMQIPSLKLSLEKFIKNQKSKLLSASNTTYIVHTRLSAVARVAIVEAHDPRELSI